ncbi:MAG TPA: BCAM0308 family protein [Candidatus Limnocylindrales bacterium]|nr:BCAM0308 family protein [Candidatus Limnocylindrales bacterium]
MMALLNRFSPASRKNMDRTTDPYIPRKSASAVGACPECHAIRRNKRWHLDEKEYAALTRKRGAAAPERCPACRKIADGFPSGVVLLRGGYLREHREEILKLVRNEEKRAMGINPLERIISITEEDAKLEIATTDEKLAQRIGREVRKACRGALEYKWSEDAKLLRVNWAREA